MRGSAVLTMFWSSAARIMVSMAPAMVRRRWRFEETRGAAIGASGVLFGDMNASCSLPIHPAPAAHRAAATRTGVRGRRFVQGTLP